MVIDMKDDGFLGLIQGIAEDVAKRIQEYRATRGTCAVAMPEAAPCADNETPAKVTAKAEKKAEPMTVLQMTAKVLKKSATPLSKDEIIAKAKDLFGADINKTTLSVALNQAMKKHKAIKRVSHGKYTNIGRKIEIKEAPKAAAAAAPAPAAEAPAPAAPAEPIAAPEAPAPAAEA